MTLGNMNRILLTSAPFLKDEMIQLAFYVKVISKPREDAASAYPFPESVWPKSADSSEIALNIVVLEVSPS
jgi:hypothetical protein